MISQALQQWFSLLPDKKIRSPHEAFNRYLFLGYVDRARKAFKTNDSLYIKKFITHILKIPYYPEVVYALWEELRSDRVERVSEPVSYLRRVLYLVSHRLLNKEDKFINDFWRDKVSIDGYDGYDEDGYSYITDSVDLSYTEEGYEQVKSQETLKQLMFNLSKKEQEICLLIAQGYKSTDLIKLGYLKDSNEWRNFRKRMKRRLKNIKDFL